MKPKKESFLPGFGSNSRTISHGGDTARGKRKTVRPLDPKQAIHVVMRSSLAKGSNSMLHPRHCNTIDTFTHRLALQWGVRVYRYANVGNHIHLLIRVPSRMVWKGFLRQLAGGIAIIVTGAKKGAALRPNESGRGFWDHLVFTRRVSFGLDFRRAALREINRIHGQIADALPLKKFARQNQDSGVSTLLAIVKDASQRGDVTQGYGRTNAFDIHTRFLFELDQNSHSKLIVHFGIANGQTVART